MSHHAIERSTFIVDVEIRDEDGVLTTPASLSWVLTDRLGAVMASGAPALASQFSVLLSGDDLLIQDGEASPAKRILLVDATYDSTLGNDLPLRGEKVFFIDDLVGDNNA